MATQATNFLDKDYSQIEKSSVVIISTSWNKEINEELIKGAKEVLASAPSVNVIQLEVPGAVELGFAIQQHYKKYQADAYIAFGCVIRGGTPHFDYVCESVNNAITQLNLSLESPIIFGVLTLETEQQAWERLGGTHGHKGNEAAQTALTMLEFMQKL